MITIVKKPEKIKVKYFRCPCGCEFTAELGDYDFCYALNEEYSYYTIECPFCHITRCYPYLEVDDVEVNVE